MASIESQLSAFAEIANNPAAVLDKHLEAGKRVIGVGPYYVPEELVTAAGAVPFGVWGCVGPSIEAKRYFAPFYCSICQMTLEMGLTHKLDKLSGIMLTGLCDTLRAASQNFKAGVEQVPMIYVSHPQNRKGKAGFDYAVTSYTEVKRKVEESAGAIIADEALAEAIKLHNQWRAAMRYFVKLAGTHPGLVSPSQRVAVINAGYYLEKAEHLAMVNELNGSLEGEIASSDGYKKVVVSGIYEDIPAVTEILEQNKFAIVADDIAKESRAFALQVPESGDPVEALAKAWCAVEGDSVAFDPEKKHIKKVVDLAKENGAAGVVILLAKFCDPEEFDAPLVVAACKEAGIPVVTVEIDQSTETYEQARTQLETFADLLG